ncbi:hypothetical protein P171DRAFT_433637 [Karstenula rhodostoma CBS 690.94]|uniref:Uncharacterized protein n=1 Tax=Karstenula rhodostoma CBS 690.94 TaxID=1392251 RepID=A0A9P4U9J4_9PLEO|nr:hypothetical protein P171DRAFT_433637 [Karstenula rhodostoma CBS 690.94]
MLPCVLQPTTRKSSKPSQSIEVHLNLSHACNTTANDKVLAQNRCASMKMMNKRCRKAKRRLEQDFSDPLRGGFSTNGFEAIPAAVGLTTSWIIVALNGFTCLLRLKYVAVN